jgi:hypothetical protein
MTTKRKVQKAAKVDNVSPEAAKEAVKSVINDKRSQPKVTIKSLQEELAIIKGVNSTLESMHKTYDTRIKEVVNTNELLSASRDYWFKQYHDKSVFAIVYERTIKKWFS